MDKNLVIYYRRKPVLMRALVLAIILAVVAPVFLHAAQPESGMKGASMDGSLQSNLGKKFPTVRAETLEGKPATIPDDAAGKVTLVAVAFLRESQPQLDSWLNPFYEKFGSRDDIMFYEVPMISGGYRFMKMIIDGGMRGGLPQFKHKHVVTMYGDVKSYKEALGIDPTSGHAFLLDRDGVIRWQEQGFARAETLGSLFLAAEDLLGK